MDYDGYANSDKRYETKLKDQNGNFLHYDLPELEKAYSNREEIRKEVEGEIVLKCKEVGMSEVNEGNFHNLLSEFYLRKEKRKKISEKEFYEKVEKIKKELSELKLEDL